ncbi:MAG: glycosyltransferase [Bacteroidales bacterium]|nr:glycosyltransferase [Bacteroidales bacterium]
MKNYRVDIIVPVYNVETLLKRCLDSLIDQTYPNWRAICVDDGSPDACGTILDEYASKDSRFFVVHKQNEGLSVARNYGVSISDAEFIMFVDSDDLIHPQTLEIALALADRDSSDIVSWYRDSYYRNLQLRYLNILKKDTIAPRPWRISKRYDMNDILSGKIRSVVTDDLLANSADWRHPKIDYSVKHCFVWRHLFRRDLIKDVKFIPGLKYEDIPWWESVLLKNPKGTITHLPLYYYYKNRRSICNTTNDVVRAEDILKGLVATFSLYRKNGNEHQMESWSHNFKWSHLTGLSRSLLKVDYRDSQVPVLLNLLWWNGAFDDARTLREFKTRGIVKSYLSASFKSEPWWSRYEIFFRTLGRFVYSRF